MSQELREWLIKNDFAHLKLADKINELISWAEQINSLLKK